MPLKSVAVIGAGPVGLAAAVHLQGHGLKPHVFERGRGAGAAIEGWGHIRLFSPWRRNIEPACEAQLCDSGSWVTPNPDYIPTGNELVEQYLRPLAALKTLRPCLQFNTEVTAITRLGIDKTFNTDRDQKPFEIITRAGGAERRTQVDAVIDASGTFSSPNPLSTNGLFLTGERHVQGLINHGVPNYHERNLSAQRILIVGGGHTAMQALVGLSHRASLTIDWAVRRAEIDTVLCVAGTDRFPARMALHAKTKEALTRDNVTLLTNTRFVNAETTGTRVRVTTLDGRARDYDQVIVATGYRPDHSFTRELQLSVDPVLECPASMRPVIDEARGFCDAVPPHGELELRHPEPNFYTVGMKSFGRAPSFLMLAGYEQVRSVVAHLAGASSNPQPLATPEEETLETFLARNPYYLKTAFA